MPFEIFSNQASVRAVVAQMSAFAIIISSLEYLVQPAPLSDGGLMTWEVASLRTRWLSLGIRGRTLNFVLVWPKILWLLGLRGILALAIVLGGHRASLSPWFLCPLVILNLLFFVRTRYGHDGADQMASIICLSLALVSLVNTQLTADVCLWFLTIQLCMAYFVAGVAKASARGWRDGTYLTGICGTRIYGNQSLAQFLQEHPFIAKSLGRAIFVWECGFPLILVAPPSVALVYLASGTVFHLCMAWVMGLNTFVWSFFAVYPAAVYCVGTTK